MVPESNNCLASLFHAESGARRQAIVANKPGGLQARVDLLSERLDVYFIVVDGVASGSVCVGIERCLVFGKWKGILKDLLVLGAEPFAIASQSLRCEQSSDAQKE